MSYRRPIRLGVLTLFVLGLAATQAAAWGPAVHAYVADHTGKRWPFLNRIEMYGAVLPDACYFAFDPAVDQDACAAVVHEQYMRMWEESFNLPYAPYPPYRALGFGYVSHNNDWGADRTAHHPLWGYIATRARLMAMLLKNVDALKDLPFEDREAIAHTVLEAATDVQVKRIDPDIGNKLIAAAAAATPNWWVNQYFLAIYGEELALAGIPPDTIEPGFRGAMFLYGKALAEETEAGTIEELAVMFAPLAQNWVPWLDDEEKAKELIVELITFAIGMTERDFPRALRNTKSYVRWNLWWRGVWY